MGRLKGICIALTVFVTMPIWYFLLYRILCAIQATELMWFLYWVYVPVGLLVGVLWKIISPDE